MRPYLLAVNHGYYFFGATLYVGVLWALRFFWYPSWEVMTVENVQDHFILPTSAATVFFTVVVPLMFVAGVVLIWTEWKTPQRWLAVLALVCIVAATLVGQLLIIPVNDTIAAGVSPETITGLFQDWMRYNDIRFVLLTAMWLTLLVYFIRKGDLLAKWSARSPAP